jgi:hypothetical protein
MRSKYSTHVVKWFRMMNTERERGRERERERYGGSASTV